MRCSEAETDQQRAFLYHGAAVGPRWMPALDEWEGLISSIIRRGRDCSHLYGRMGWGWHTSSTRFLALNMDVKTAKEHGHDGTTEKYRISCGCSGGCGGHNTWHVTLSGRRTGGRKLRP